MNFEYEQMGPDSRIWIYQSAVEIPVAHYDSLLAEMRDFTANWSAHQKPLAAYSTVKYQRFLILMADEKYNLASGCSIDDSVHFIRHLEQKYDLSLFDRLNFAFWKDNLVRTASKSEFVVLYQNGEIRDDTLVFDNLVSDKKAFHTSWQKPLRDCWMRKFVNK